MLRWDFSFSDAIWFVFFPKHILWSVEGIGKLLPCFVSLLKDVSVGLFCWQLQMFVAVFPFSASRLLQVESLRGRGRSGFCCYSLSSFRASPSSLGGQIMLLFLLLLVCLVSWCLFLHH